MCPRKYILGHFNLEKIGKTIFKEIKNSCLEGLLGDEI